VPAHQLGGQRAGVAHGDVVGEHVVLVFRPGLGVDVLGDRLDLDAIGVGCAHALSPVFGDEGSRR